MAICIIKEFDVFPNFYLLPYFIIVKDNFLNYP